MTTAPGAGASCPICRAEFTPAGPRHRYCCERCRKTAWRRRHPRPALDQPEGVLRLASHVLRPQHVARPRDVPRDVPAAAGSSETAPPTRCPHCAGPIAVISLLLDPAAAQVTTPREP